ncbi:hypothetical protein FO519_000592 [Halicephalobus sp. NKZ332]|nr:hypothetical protein FO519_000592 [Halicephalobus sp. NKZ332]
MSLVHLSCPILACTSLRSAVIYNAPLRISVRQLGRRPPKPGKPPNLPPAKKVLYRVIDVPWMKSEDVKELLWRRHAYNNAITSLRAVFKKEIEAKEAAGLGIEALRAREKEELDVLLLKNEEENKGRARMREALEKETCDKLKAEFLEDIELKLNEQDEMVKQSTEEVRRSLEESESFVTLENLDEKLLAALENPTVFDYCIDLQGQKFHDPVPVKYLEGTPTRQKGRSFDRSLVAPRNIARQEAKAVIDSQKSGMTLEDKISNLQDIIYKRPIVPMNLDRWKNYVRSAPRNYSMIVMFTALSTGVNCPICKPAYDEFYILANSYRYGHMNDKALYFGVVEFEENQQIFQQMNLNTAPVIFHFPAKGREKRHDQMEFQRFGIDADAMAKFVAERTGIHIHVLRPPNYAAPVVIMLLVMLIMGLLYMRRNNLEFLYNRTFWGLVCVAIVLCFMSGQMWNHIRGPPFFMTHPQTRETSFIHGSTQYQLVSETYIVLGFYGIITAGMVLLLEAPERKDYKKFASFIGIGIVAVFFSLLLSVFRMKYQGYPYHFLFH